MGTRALVDRESTENVFDPGDSLLSIAWRRRTGLLCGCAIGLIVSAAYYYLCAPVYQSSAQLLILPKHSDTLSRAAIDRSPVDYVANQMAILRSPLIAERSARKLEQSVRILPESIVRQVTVNRPRELSASAGSVLSISMRGSDPNQCGAVLSAVIASYQEIMDESYQRDSGDALELMKRARDELRQELDGKESAYRQFRASSPLLGREKEWFEVWKERLGGIEAKRTVLLLERAEVEGEMLALDRAIAAGESDQSLAVLVVGLVNKAESHSGGSGRALTLQEQLLPLRREEERLLVKFGPDHPAVQSVRTSIVSTLDRFARPAFSDAGVGEPATPRDAVQARIVFLKRSLDQLAIEDRLLSELADVEQAESARMMAQQLQDETNRAEVIRAQQRYDEVVKRLQDVELDKDLGGFEARVLAPPGSSGVHRLQPSRLVAIALGLLSAIAVGAALGYVAEVTDKRLHTK